MASYSETGHAKNVAQFNLEVTYVKEVGTDWKPSNTSISVASLEAKETACATAMAHTTDALIPSKNAINARDKAYKEMPKKATRMINALKGCGAGKDVMKDARGILNKIRGQRTGPEPESPPPNPENPETTGGKGHSVSQLSFDYRKENFSVLVAFLAGQTIYNPNEADLKITSLQAYLVSLGTFNGEVNRTETRLVSARGERDVVLYAPETGISELTGTIKGYALSLLGTDNPIYKKIKKIRIKRPPK